jgi:alpha-1,2-mannosyltransferase
MSAPSAPPAAGRPPTGAVHPHLAFALAVIAAIAWALVGLYFASGHGALDVLGYSKGQDFINVWTAGRMTVEGRAAEVFEPARFLESTRRLFGAPLPPHFWSYPPTALFAALPLGFTDYWTGYVLWSSAGLGLLAWAAWGAFPDRRELALFLASPAVAMNLVMGQNGCLTAALWMAGAALVARRPALGGALFGLLTLKPQLGLLIPVQLVAERRWRAIAAAGAAAVALAAMSAVVFGPETWVRFVRDTLPTQASSMSIWRGPYQWFMPSAFMAGRLLGLSANLALAIQALFALAAAALVWRAARREADPAARWALLFVATFVATPQSSAYDMIPTAAAALLLARRGRGLADAVLAALLWAAPWAVVAVNALGAPVIPLLMAWAALRLAQLCGPPTPDVALARSAALAPSAAPPCGG